MTNKAVFKVCIVFGVLATNSLVLTSTMDIEMLGPHNLVASKKFPSSIYMFIRDNDQT